MFCLYSTALKKCSNSSLNVRHLFSCEIDRKKARYIRKNFNTRCIFRDIRELGYENNTHGTTTFGTKEPIPHNVDMLVAGFPCVDFSTMNNHRKTLSDLGESGDVLKAIMLYCQKFYPRFVILENVTTADWTLVKDLWMGDRRRLVEKLGPEMAPEWFIFGGEEHPGYECAFLLLDTKSFYLPHSRRRVYMFLAQKGTLESSRTAVNVWRYICSNSKRFTSCSVEEFMYGVNSPALRLRMRKLCRKERGRSHPWAMSSLRYRRARLEERMRFFGRPITHWQEAGGSVVLRDDWWKGSVMGQQERIWDHLEIAFLRRALDDDDLNYRSRVLELSQNIDRDKDTVSTGLAPCQTPTGMPFLTNRGGPITGRETLALHGIPVQKLNLSGMKERFIQNMSGNAMSTTTAGTAILSALAVGAQAIRAGQDNRVALGLATSLTTLLKEKSKGRSKIRDQRRRHRRPRDYSSRAEKKIETRYLDEPVELGYSAATSTQLQILQHYAKHSLQRCLCETGLRLTTRPMLECELCGHVSCMNCSGLPEHRYVPKSLQQRFRPTEVRQLIKDNLPKRIKIQGLNTADLRNMTKEMTGTGNQADWDLLEHTVKLIESVELSFDMVSRGYVWKATFSSRRARLELVIDKQSMRWLLYATPDPSSPVNSRVRELLRDYLAFMIPTGQRVTEGQWKFRLPKLEPAVICIRREGPPVPSWKNRMGLLDFRTQMVSARLRVTHNDILSRPEDPRIDGLYELLPACGTANGSLHRNIDRSGVFLFRETVRDRDPENDYFVFATDHRRLGHREQREVLARLPPTWRSERTPAERREVVEYRGEWIDSAMKLETLEETRPPMYRSIRGDIPLNGFGEWSQHSRKNCRNSAIALMTIEVPSKSNNSKGNQLELRLDGHKTWKLGSGALKRRKKLGPILEQARLLNNFPKALRVLSIPSNISMRLLRWWKCCRRPKKQTRWRWSKAGNRVQPHGHGLLKSKHRRARDWQGSWKGRPAIFKVRQKQNSRDTKKLMISFNLLALIHRALARLKWKPSMGKPTLSWSLDVNYDRPPAQHKNRFTVKPNFSHPEVDFTFGEGQGLSAMQKRSLGWMIAQESVDNEPWVEKQIAEMRIGQLKWRAQVQASIRKRALGGALADTIGAGKTPMTIGLIHHQKAQTDAEANIRMKGFISLKATLILAPPTLLSQWKSEIERYLNVGLSIVVINVMEDLKKTSIATLQQTDILVVSMDLLRSPSYWDWLSKFACFPQGPTQKAKKGKFLKWVKFIRPRIAKHVEELKQMTTSDELVQFADTLDRRLEQAEDNPTLKSKTRVGRLRGANYQMYGSEKPEREPKKIKERKARIQETPRVVQMEQRSADGASKPHTRHQRQRKAQRGKDDDNPHLFENDLERYIPEYDQRYDAEYHIKGSQYVGYEEQASERAAIAMEKDDQNETLNLRKVSERGAIGCFRKADHWQNLTCPYLQMFRFSRIVVDEHQYLERSLVHVVRSIPTPRRWILSGTPPKGTARSIRRMAKLIGVSIGMQKYSKKLSAEWFRERRLTYERFVARYIRGNPSGMVQWFPKPVLWPIPLSAHEYLIYHEWQHELDQMEYSRLRSLASKDSSKVNDRLKKQFKRSTAITSMVKIASIFEAPCENFFPALIQNRKERVGFLWEKIITLIRMLVWNAEQQDRHSRPRAPRRYIQRTLLNKPEKEDAGYQYWLEHQLNAEVRFGRVKAPVSWAEVDFCTQYNYDAYDACQLYAYDKTDDNDAYGDSENSDNENSDRISETAVRLAPEPRTVSPPNLASAMDLTQDDAMDISENDTETVVPLVNGSQAVAPAISNSDDTDSDNTETESKKPLVKSAFPARRLERYVNEQDRIEENLDLDVPWKLATASWRRAVNIRKGAVWMTGQGPAFPCGGCSLSSQDPRNFTINWKCGHMSCALCCKGRSRCPVDGCAIEIRKRQLKPLTHFYNPQFDDQSKYGGKIQAVVQLIKQTPADDQVVVFVPFENMLRFVDKAFEAFDISHHTLSSDKRRLSDRIMDAFKNERGSKAKKALILNSGNDTCAGA